jgi:hypothetical protein
MNRSTRLRGLTAILSVLVCQDGDCPGTNIARPRPVGITLPQWASIPMPLQTEDCKLPYFFFPEITAVDDDEFDDIVMGYLCG